MHLPRLHLFELMDQSWFPSVIRDLLTDYLRFIETKFALHQPAALLVAEALQRSNCTRIVDLCSGGGGSIPNLLPALAAQGVRPQVTLTDRFPNTQAFEQVAAAFDGQISFHSHPVDARIVPPDMPQACTRCSMHSTTFGHGRRWRCCGTRCKRGSRNLRTLVPMFFLVALLVAITTPFIRPFRWQRLLWTYLLPLVPLACWWDGVVSQLRAYSSTELQDLAEAAGAHTYGWRAGRVPLVSNPGHLTYLIGYPDETERNGAFGFKEHARPQRPPK